MKFIAFVDKKLLSFIAQLSLFLRQTLDTLHLWDFFYPNHKKYSLPAVTLKLTYFIRSFFSFPDFKICWFCCHPIGSTRNMLVKKILILFPEKPFFRHKYIILAMITLESKVNLFFPLQYSLVVFVVLTFLAYCPLCMFH